MPYSRTQVRAAPVTVSNFMIVGVFRRDFREVRTPDRVADGEHAAALRQLAGSLGGREETLAGPYPAVL